ncbi:CbtA family protein [Nocardioides flavescens]|uniref:CbtA family protein n=1 Tax=Nocardioides flavescens TaxID=2691959 RepID=A0A6L7F4K7_9ACTN|nr:CbtA family protein [Nocardioides flavescens]MXG92208.1 hypothetical protein [Nocardioides flavescens]
MSPRSFLVRGLLVGLLAGIAAFLVAHQVGEPNVERAIALESTGSADGHTHAEDTPAHTHGSESESGGGTEISRGTQRTWGLLTGTLAIGVASGGILALLAAGLVGRLGRLSPAGSTAVVAAVGFVAYAVVPFLKYPPNPPAVGSGETIGQRTAYYFVFVLVSIVSAALAVALAQRTWRALGPVQAVVLGVTAYVAVVAATAALMPTVDEVGDFPASLLWSFRTSSLLTLTTLWAVLCGGLALAVGRLHEQTRAVAARRELARSL